MFGKPPPPNSQNGAGRPAAVDVAILEGGGLAQVIVTNLSPLTYYVFLNDRVVAPEEIESLSVSIEAPDGGIGSAIVRATLARYVVNVTGERSQQRTELFPCTLEIIALNRRIAITCQRADSLEGLWISLGLKPDGTSSDVTGAKSLRILLTDGILDAKLTWTDGETEDLLPPQ